MVAFEFKSPLEAHSFLLKGAHFFSDYLGTTLLFSSDHHENATSYLFLFPYKKISIRSELNPWNTLKKKMGEFKSSGSSLPEWVGFLSYEMGAYSDEHLILPHSNSPYPLAYFQKSAITLVQKGSKLIVVLRSEFQSKVLEKRSSIADFFKENFWEDFLKNPPQILFQQKEHFFEEEEQETPENYIKSMERAQDYIRRGDIYQVNLSRSLIQKTNLSPFELFTSLTQINPVPFSAYLNYGPFQIISASPERFLSSFQGRLEARPIKGTISRDNRPEYDLLQRDKLLKSPKENAELMMICDLMRNDLGRVSEIGSVRCLNRVKLLTLSNVFHLESVIEGRALDLHPIDLIRKCFPAGSITGCPKIRSMQIINELEKRPRHIYCGSIGYLTGQGDFDFNVAIRTGVFKEGFLELQLGGAITYDSLLEEEYQETCHKGSPFKKAISQLKR